MTEENPNRLANSASPYLHSAAHQPVAWHEWGEEAFARARAEDKPILLDIGAVWCHWCHVIDRESYDDVRLAEMINRLYIPVKVDRDERPDVDSRYQTAVGAMSGRAAGRSPSFLLPDGRPFYGGTYFPPEDAMGRPSFRRVLESAAEAYRTRRDEVEQAAGALFSAVAQAELFAGARSDWDARLVDALLDSALQRFDPHYGGFGKGPKFPHSQALELILERYQATREPRLLLVAQTTLDKMAQGGVYDQLGGGFHRYSVDERWLVPHFEKMSYDNSELLKNYLHAYLVAPRPLYRETAEGIIDWVNRVLSDRERGSDSGTLSGDARAALAARRADHARQNGAGRRLRPARRRLPSLLGGRALAGAALRENVLRQFRAAEKLSPRQPGRAAPALSRNGRGHHRLGEPRALRPRARRLLRQPGCRHHSR